MKKVVILTNEFDKVSVVVDSLMDAKIVSDKSDIGILHLKDSQIDIHNGDGTHNTINSALGSVNSYIKRAKYVCIHRTYLLCDHLVQYLIKGISSDKIITDAIISYRYSAKAKCIPKDTASMLESVYNDAYDNIMDHINDDFTASAEVFTNLLDLVHTANNKFYESINDMVEEASASNPDAGFIEHPSVYADTLFNLTNWHGDCKNEIVYYYDIARPKANITDDDDDTLLSLSIKIIYDADNLTELMNPYRVGSVDNLKYAKLCVALANIRNGSGKHLINVQIPLDQNMVTDERAIKTSIHDENWKTTLKDDGYDDVVITFTDALMDSFSSDKFFRYM